ncbi:MAG: M14 family metallopeptidase [bacterium]|nr:M14 family metallopeptidase [bacterium]
MSSPKKFGQILYLLFVLILALGSSAAAGYNPSYSANLPVDTVPFYEGGNYDPAIPSPQEFFPRDFSVWPVRYHEMVEYITAVAAVSDRVKIEQHGSSWEGRELYNVFISSPDNIARLDGLRAGMDKIASPGSFSGKAALQEAVAQQPCFAWLGYSIHGDEISGMDAAIQLIYHLTAARDSVSLHLLNNVVVIVDPTENPDGRERYLSMLQSNQSHVPNYDMNAMQHQGRWPWGRGNHYLFDLNRDWILGTQRETLGRWKTILTWNPVLVVDAHEMGSDDNFLFTPPRQPINYNTPSTVRKWWQQFSADQAAALDRHGWPYYVGEWHEQWYPGYGSSWSSMFGTVAILYEQAGVDGFQILQPGDYLLTYHEAMNHHFTSSLANLTTAANNRAELLSDYYSSRAEIAESGQSSGLKFLFAPDRDEMKMKRFVERLVAQGIKVERAEESFTISTATNIYGEKVSSKEFPSGSFIVRTSQPHGALAKAILEFDPRLKLQFLKEERRELEKFDESRMYEVSTWSLPLAYDLDAYSTKASLNVKTEQVNSVPLSSGQLHNRDAAFGYIIDMEGEKTFLALNRLFAEDINVYGSEREFSIEGNDYRSGALVIRKRGNAKNLPNKLEKITVELGINIYGVNSGSSSAGSFLGAPTFALLKQPRVALLTGSPLNFNAYGALWFTIDREIGLPHSLIEFSSLPYTDIDQYNVIVMPPSWGPMTGQMGSSATEKLRHWVRSGGTLICAGSSAAWAADSTTGISSAALRRQSLEKLDEYGKALERAIRAEAPPLDTMDLWHPERAKPAEVTEEKSAPLGNKELEDLDQWQRKFSPEGAILRVDIDQDDWLSFGLKDRLPVFLSGSYSFLAKEPVRIGARFSAENELRVSGLLWPEARHRLANSVYASHETVGKGQVILFAKEPNKRAFFYGSRTMFVTALLYGPGMGTRGVDPY